MDKKQPVKAIKIVCDECKKAFKFKRVRLKYKAINDDVERLYYKCPHCNKKYNAGFKNKEINCNLERMKEISNDIKINPKRSEELMIKWNNLKERNIEIMNSLTALYGEEV